MTARVRARLEPWGAWARVDDPPALAALDREGARALGLDGGHLWNDDAPHDPRPPIEVHLAVTGRCAAGCEGCYLDARPDGLEPAAEEIVEAIDAIARAGAFTIAFGGGEPTTRADIDVLARAARARGLNPVMTTSGLGLSDAKIERLDDFAQINVSYDGDGAAYARVRGFDGSAGAERAIRALVARGIAVGVNVVLTRTTFDAIEDTLRRAASLGAREAQLLRYKPAGRAASLDYLDKRLTADQARALGPTLRHLATALPNMRIRIDCALVPFLSADDSLRDPAALARFGVFGCEAGEALAAVRVDGRVAPCSFSEPSDLHVHDFPTAHVKDATLGTFRAWNAAPSEPCASCTLFSVCKGGCKVVTHFTAHTHGPDPECPRVRAHRDREHGA